MRFLLSVVVLALAAAVPAQTGHYRPYSVSSDFHEVANRKSFEAVVHLAPDHRRLLKKNLFVVSPRGDDQLYEIYAVNDYRNLPSLITTDTVLHLYHVFFDATLRKIEADPLYPKLERMSAKLEEASRQQAKAAPDGAMRAAALKNADYFSVALCLVKPSASPSAATKTELARIKAASGYEPSAIFPYKVDYSRFIVRGHYTRSETLQRYFRAMTWYGLMPFALTDRVGKPVAEQIRMAVLAANALRTSGEEADWQAIYIPTELYAGASNMFTPSEVRQTALKVFQSTQRLDPSRFPAFVAALRSLRTPKIQARITQRSGVPATDVQFRFMGMRYIPDSEILQNLTGEQRPMPSGLDVMAALGSSRAAGILDADHSAYNPQGWTEYRPERVRLTAQLAAIPTDAWRSNLYWSWLDTLRLLLKPIPSGFPQFMLSSAWQDKDLSTALASWTELRHDTILYGEQSASEMGSGEEKQPFVKGFVEPRQDVYERLLDLSKQSRTALQKMHLIDKAALDQFASYEDMLSFFATVSHRELEGRSLTRAEHLRIRKIDGEFYDMTEVMLKYGTNFEALTDDDRNMALVADVHTAGNTALEEGVGKADDLIAVVPIEGKLYFARGCAFSYYEFAVPISKRMTDEGWKASLQGGKDHPRPAWTSDFFTKSKTKEKE